jgi:hypothetical protein
MDFIFKPNGFHFQIQSKIMLRLYEMRSFYWRAASPPLPQRDLFLEKGVFLRND